MGGIAIRFSESSSRRSSRHSSIHSRREQSDRQQDEASGLVSSEAPISVTKAYDQPLESKEASSKVHPEQAVNAESISRTLIESEVFPEFLKKFQKRQKRHLGGLGDIPWAPFSRHMRLAAEYTHHTPSKDKPRITDTNHLAPLHGDLWILDSKQLTLARKLRVIQKLPSIRLEEIHDKSKADGLIRLLAVVQVLWLVIQFIVRRFEHLSSSALEFSTLAFSSCAIIIYLMEWHKAKDVAMPIYIDTDAIVKQKTFDAIAEAAPTIFLQTRHYYMPQSCVHQVIEGRWHQTIKGGWQCKHTHWLIILMSILSTTLFGGIHLFAWNIEFPNLTERVLWRTSALLVTILPSVCALLVLLESFFCHTTDKLPKLSVCIFAPFYLSSRIFLIVESLRSLYFLPTDALAATWATNIPHFS